MTTRTLLIALALLPAGAARACLNDRDTTTLADVAGRFPNAVQVITGRFPRNPPLYYEMRIQRITQDLAKNPNLLPEYDDIAVACDRVGRDDEAIGWMEKKRARMLALGTPGLAPDAGDTPWYRYYANNGTFWVHRYMRNPGKHPLTDVHRAEWLIQTAIAIYPKAHFGRERFQVYAMDWMLDMDEHGGYPQHESLGEYIVQRGMTQGDGSYDPNQRNATLDGISGIIVLGAGWESVDMFDALAEAFHYHRVGGSPIADLAYYRVHELLRAGKRSGWPGHELLRYTKVPAEPRGGVEYWSTESNYVRLRKEAEEWQARRTAYMMARLSAGRHPDTDPTFWAEYKETPPPPIYNAPLPVRVWWWAGNNEFPLYLIIGTFVPLALFGRSRWIAYKTRKPSRFAWSMLVLLLMIVWFIGLGIFPLFAKARG